MGTLRSFSYSPKYRRYLERREEFLEWVFMDAAVDRFPAAVETANESVDMWLAEVLIDLGVPEEAVEELDREALLRKIEIETGERPKIYDLFIECLTEQVGCMDALGMGEMVDTWGLKTTVWKMGEYTEFAGWPEEDE
jgi:hypothetical protein